METNIDNIIRKNKHKDVLIAPMHTAEHILNQTMIRMFGCERSKNTHIERKKSKCDYHLAEAPTQETIAEIERQVNQIIESNLPVSATFVDKDNIPSHIDLSKLPEDVSQTLRVVTVGDYDVCACIGEHVGNTSEIGVFSISSYDYADGKLRLRFKLAER